MPLRVVPRNFVWLAAVALPLASAGSAANAGGFAVREQSTSGLGAAFAGVAAGYDLSSIYWNPAGVSIAKTTQSESHAALFSHQADMKGTATLQPPSGPSTELSFLDPSSGETLSPAFVSAMYAGMPVNDRLTIGLGLNSPFGLTTKPDNDNWVGKFEARTSKLFTLNFNPVTSYQLTDRLAVGVGAQVEYVYARLKSAFPGVGGLAGSNPNAAINGDDLGFGYTLGILWSPTNKTDLGFGFRSSVEHDLKGDFSVAGVFALGSTDVAADFETPEIATASIRQKVGEQLTLLGTLEWTNWSDLTEVTVKSKTTNPMLGLKPGSVVAALPLNWDDGWFFSGGAEFDYNERMTLRGGLAYEISPIRTATQRTPRTPDTDRIWLSVGGTYKYSEMVSFDLAYSHVFFEDGSIDRTTDLSGLGQVRLLAEAEKSSDIFAASMKIKLGSPPSSSLK